MKAPSLLSIKQYLIHTAIPFQNIQRALGAFNQILLVPKLLLKFNWVPFR